MNTVAVKIMVHVLLLHSKVHFLLFIYKSSTNSEPLPLTSSCHGKILGPLLHYWKMHVCTYDTIKWAPNILFKEML